MGNRFNRLWFLWTQYSLKEFILLIIALVLDFILIRIPEYLLFTKNSFDKYYKKSLRAQRKGNETLITLQNLNVILRRNSSDFLVFDQIFIEEGLKPIVELIKKKNIEVKNILDCGANIGLTSLYLNQLLPEANILALEPEPDNFTQLVKNINQNTCKKVSCIQIGAWSKKALLEHDINFCFAKGWAFSVREPLHGIGSIRVDTLENIISSNNFPKVDYLKMDIEGSEFELFRNINTWKSVFDNVKIISVEVHEKGGEIREIENILRKSGFELEKFGELITAWRQ